MHTLCDHMHCMVIAMAMADMDRDGSGAVDFQEFYAVRLPTPVRSALCLCHGVCCREGRGCIGAPPCEMHTVRILASSQGVGTRTQWFSVRKQRGSPICVGNKLRAVSGERASERSPTARYTP